MSGFERVLSAPTASAVSASSELGVDSAMAECLRAQASREPESRVERLFGLNPLSARASVFYPGALNELETAVTLAALGSQWMVAYSTQNANGVNDADHLVVGPSGAFLVCSRQHSHAKVVTAGRLVMVNGRRVAYVRDVVAGADRVAAALVQLGAPATTVRPLVVLSGASSVVRGRMRAPVPVLQLGELASWLLRQPTFYSPAEVRTLATIAGGLGQWQVQPSTASTRVRLTARFERLRSEVDVARRRNRLWIVTGGAVSLAAVVAAVVVVIPAIARLFSS